MTKPFLTFVPAFDLLRMFLNLLPVRRDWDGCAKLPVEVVLDRWFAQVADVGTVVAGLVEQGSVTCGDTLLLGPTELGQFELVVVDSMQVGSTLKVTHFSTTLDQFVEMDQKALNQLILSRGFLKSKDKGLFHIP